MKTKLEQTRDDALTRLRAAERIYADAAAVLIIAELSEDIDSRQAVIVKWERAVRDANTALAEPEKRLADAKTEVEKCQSRIAHCQAQTQDDDLDTRVDAEILLSKYQGQLPALQAKVTEIENETAQLRRDRDKAQNQLEAEQTFIRMLKQAMLAPFTNPLAQMTQAYIGYRLPTVLIETLSSGNRDDDKEWDICHRMLGEILLISGIRSEDYRLPDIEVVDVSAYMPSGNEQKAQSAQEIMAQVHADAVNATMLPTTSPEYMQDRPPRTLTRPELDHERIPERYTKP